MPSKLSPFSIYEILFVALLGVSYTVLQKLRSNSMKFQKFKFVRLVSIIAKILVSLKNLKEYVVAERLGIV